jgi:hypothetical protein
MLSAAAVANLPIPIAAPITIKPKPIGSSVVGSILFISLFYFNDER